MSRTCLEVAGYRYTWPGQDESFICEVHVVQLRGVADAMGLHLQTIEVEADELVRCNQQVGQ